MQHTPHLITVPAVHVTPALETRLMPHQGGEVLILFHLKSVKFPLSLVWPTLQHHAEPPQAQQ